ncbi:MAG: DUF423 domain-containing protein [Trueperaceae bacterium]|nr:DUF423 domain-containing protein [Trueperaceae bacterium]
MVAGAEPRPPRPARTVTAAQGWAATGALLAGLAVALGAVGAHLLAPALPPDRLETFDTATRYLQLHGLALLLVSVLPPPARAAAPLLLAGSLTFGGALYLLILTDAGAFGAVAPVGGAMMIAGWGVLAWRMLRA